MCIRDRYSLGHGVARAPSRSLEFWSSACDDGDMPACFELAKSYAAGRGVRPDHDRALSLYKKACEAAVPGACEGLKAVH